MLSYLAEGALHSRRGKRLEIAQAFAAAASAIEQVADLANAQDHLGRSQNGVAVAREISVPLLRKDLPAHESSQAGDAARRAFEDAVR